MMVGKTFRSKINGNLFMVDGRFEADGRIFYSVLDMASGKHFAVSKCLFENDLMQNLEGVNNDGRADY